MPTFVDFWMVYPKRKGSNPRYPAELKFKTAIQKGADPTHIVSSARKFAEQQREQGLIDTPYVPMASTWLNQQRWRDYAMDTEDRVVKSDEIAAKHGYYWNGERYEKRT